MVERTVFIHLPGETEAVPAGRLTMIEQGLQVQASTFAYGRRYVARANALPVDPVARFHLGNGAQMERLNWQADASKKGRAQSCGMMVNYLYELDALDDNLAQLGEGSPRIGRGIAKLL